MFVFFNLDVIEHLSSDYQQRISRPSVTNSGVGSPFISGMLHPNEIIEDWIKRGPDSNRSSLYRLSIPRNRLIVPTRGNNISQPDWQKYALEVLVVGDVGRDSIKEIKPI